MNNIRIVHVRRTTSLSTPFWEFPEITKTFLCLIATMSLSTPFWEFRFCYSHLHTNVKPDVLSTPFWEFRCVKNTQKPQAKIFRTFYSLLGVSHKQANHVHSTCNVIFLLPFGSFFVKYIEETLWNELLVNFLLPFGSFCVVL